MYNIEYIAAVLCAVCRKVLTHGHAVLCKKCGQVLAAYPVVPAGESESRQLTGAYPSQDGGVADAATLGNKTDRDIFRNPLLRCFLQGNLPIRVNPLTEVIQRELLAFSVLAVFGMFEVYESAVTVMSHGTGKSSQINHKKSVSIHAF